MVVALADTNGVADVLVRGTQLGTASAPPGFYMLNVVDTAGVPSVSEWVQLS